VSVAAIEPHFWRNLCRLLGLEQWSDRQTADEDQDAIRADLRLVFATKSRDQWTELLAPADTCVAPVLSVPEVIDDTQFVARNAFVDVVHPTAGRFRQTSALFAGQLPPHAPGEPVQAPDYTRTATVDLLGAVGYTATELDTLVSEGVIA
jgi:alpha-methylacyl-CoA racemase